MNPFDEIKSYVGFSDEDRERLKRLHPIVEPHFPEVVDQFYARLWDYPRAKAVFTGPEQVQRLRRSLYDWLASVFGGVYDQHYFTTRQRIGGVHVEVGLLPQLMFGAMSVLRTQLLAVLLHHQKEAVEEAFGGPQGVSSAVISVERILDIELTIMLQSYWSIMMKQKLQIPATLATGLAHEMRNPLNAIGLQMTLLERKLRGAQVQASTYEPVLDAVQAELRRIQGLNSEILDFAKPVEVVVSPTNMVTLLEEIQRSHQLTLDAGGVVMTITAQGDVVIPCDGPRMVQVFVNLLTNAVEAMTEGGAITVDVAGSDAGVVIDFTDTGAGMSPALKFQIFDLFHTTKAAGTGIGLPIARKIVEAHRGAIDVISRPGEGTTFTVYLPREHR